MLQSWKKNSKHLIEHVAIPWKYCSVAIYVWMRTGLRGKSCRFKCLIRQQMYINPLRPNSDLSQTSHCNIKGLSLSEVMRIENMITQVKFY